MTGPRLSIIPANAVLDKHLTHLQLRTLLALGTHQDAQGWMSPSCSTIGQFLGVGRDDIERSIDELVNLGYLEKRFNPHALKGERNYIVRVILDTLEEEPEDD